LKLREDASALGGTPGSELKNGHVEIAVRAASLNFRDVVHVKYLKEKNLPFVRASFYCSEKLYQGVEMAFILIRLRFQF